MRNILPIGEPTAEQGHIAIDGTEYILCTRCTAIP